jgi:hypothetical protein
MLNTVHCLSYMFHTIQVSFLKPHKKCRNNSVRDGAADLQRSISFVQVVKETKLIKTDKQVV